ncbi:MAG: tripartite tricarboxylate transporter permease [Egibacteraceae bacterium]
MELLDLILGGFRTALSVENVLYCFIGVLLGTVIGLLPGLGSATGVALLLPLTIGQRPVTALIMLAGIYYGCQYGGTISSVLIATPGDSSTVVSAFDGYQMARRGRAGPALAIAAVASFVAGTISIAFLMTLAPVLSGFALRFGPPENFAILVLGMLSIVGFGRNRMKGFAMAALGLTLAMVGIDAQTGVSRFTFGNPELLGGVGFLQIVIGLFAVGEVMRQVSQGLPHPIRTRFREMLLTRDDLRRSGGPIVRGGLLGFLIGTLPGGGATIASFLSYDVERRVHGTRRKSGTAFGEGAIEGIAGPEAANNAAANGAFVPTLTLGIPGSATTAVLLGAFLLYGIQPGPLLLTEQSELAWGLMASFYIGNVMLLGLNLPFAPVFASILRLPYAYLYPIILLVSYLGAYAVENRMWGAWLALAFGVLGYLMIRFEWPAAPVILGVILGGLMEQTLVQTSSMGGGDLSIFLRRPLALGIFGLSVLFVVVPPLARRARAARVARELEEVCS